MALTQAHARVAAACGDGRGRYEQRGRASTQLPVALQQREVPSTKTLLVSLRRWSR